METQRDCSLGKGFLQSWGCLNSETKKSVELVESEATWEGQSKRDRTKGDMGKSRGKLVESKQLLVLTGLTVPTSSGCCEDYLRWYLKNT